MQGQCGDIVDTLLGQCVDSTGLCHYSEGTVMVFSWNITGTVPGQYGYNMKQCVTVRGQCCGCAGKILGQCSDSAGIEWDISRTVLEQSGDSVGTLLGLCQDSDVLLRRHC